MPFEARGPKVLDAVINVRCTQHEKAHLKRSAEEAGMSLSEYVRRRALGRVVIASADAAVLRELRRLGGLLKHVHISSGGAYSHYTAEALTALRLYIEQLARGRQL